jgi:hypothetical protein
LTHHLPNDRHQYQAYDVTSLIRPGDETVQVAREISGCELPPPAPDLHLFVVGMFASNFINIFRFDGEIAVSSGLILQWGNDLYNTDLK